MGNKEAKNNNKLVDQERQRGIDEHKKTMSYLQPERQETKQWSDAARDDIYGGYKKFADGSAFANGAGGSGGGGGGYAAYNPEMLKLTGTLEDAKGRYKNFADTGGYTEDDKNNIRARAISPISGFYDGLQRDMSHMRTAGQGSNIGFGESLQRMAREKARMSADVARDADLNIMDRVNAGKQYGLTGYTGIGNTEQDIDNNNVNERNQASQINASNARAAAAAADADARWRMGMQMEGLDRMADFYQTSPAELSRYDNMLMAERGMASDQFQNSNRDRMAYNPNVSAWDRAMQIGGLAAGAVSPFLGGLGNSGINGGRVGTKMDLKKLNGEWM